MKLLMIIFGFALCAASLVNTIVKRRVLSRGGKILTARDSQPIRYWLQVAAQMIFALLAMFAGYGLFDGVR